MTSRSPLMNRRNLLRLSAGLTAVTAGIGLPSIVWPGQAGIGGTGQAVNLGAGRSPAGLGGTGVYGLVEAFGSIFVNGLHLEFADTTQVRLNGLPVPTSALQLMMPVAVTSAIDPTESAAEQMFAQNINGFVAVRGPVLTVDAYGQPINVLGQSVVTTPQTLFELAKNLRPGIRNGAWAQVLGERDAQGRIIARKVTQVAPDGLVQLHGFVTSPDSISGVYFQNLRSAGAFQIGQRLAITAQMQAGGLLFVSHAVALAPTFFDSESVSNILLSGTTDSYDGGLVVDGIRMPLQQTQSSQLGDRLLLSARTEMGGLADIQLLKWDGNLRRNRTFQRQFVRSQRAAVRANRLSNGIRQTDGQPKRDDINPNNNGRIRGNKAGDVKTGNNARPGQRIGNGGPKFNDPSSIRDQIKQRIQQ